VEKDDVWSDFNIVDPTQPTYFISFWSLAALN